MQLITVKDKDMGLNDYKNELTTELDKYVVKEHLVSIEYGGGTYLYGHPNEGHMGIRFPGATRGSIIFNKKGIITNVFLYDDAVAWKVQCYKKEAYEMVKKYIGYEIVFKED